MPGGGGSVRSTRRPWFSVRGFPRLVNGFLSAPQGHDGEQSVRRWEEVNVRTRALEGGKKTDMMSRSKESESPVNS
jgi:hypothetical protein